MASLSLCSAHDIVGHRIRLTPFTKQVFYYIKAQTRSTCNLNTLKLAWSRTVCIKPINKYFTNISFWQTKAWTYQRSIDSKTNENFRWSKRTTWMCCSEISGISVQIMEWDMRLVTCMCFMKHYVRCLIYFQFAWTYILSLTINFHPW